MTTVHTAATPVPNLRVAPSILSADFGSLAAAVSTITPGTDWLHGVHPGPGDRLGS